MIYLFQQICGGKTFDLPGIQLHLSGVGLPFFHPLHSIALFLQRLLKGLQAQRCVHPRKLTCPLKICYFNRKYIFQPMIFRGHVSFPGSNAVCKVGESAGFGGLRASSDEVFPWWCHLVPTDLPLKGIHLGC